MARAATMLEVMAKLRAITPTGRIAFSDGARLANKIWTHVGGRGHCFEQFAHQAPTRAFMFSRYDPTTGKRAGFWHLNISPRDDWARFTYLVVWYAYYTTQKALGGTRGVDFRANDRHHTKLLHDVVKAGEKRGWFTAAPKD